MSKTQIDRLGDRLKLGSYTDEDLELLATYRQSFVEAYEFVLKTIREHGKYPTGRAKITQSIVEKLNRGRKSLRLSQMQDIAGCRVVVIDILAQDQFVEKLQQLFPNATVNDRRQQPSHGYRAVHVIVSVNERSIEVQVRSELQHRWAELSEKASDVVDPDLKYGLGPVELRSLLLELSNSVAKFEEFQINHSIFLNQEQTADLAHDIAKDEEARLADHDLTGLQSEDQSERLATLQSQSELREDQKQRIQNMEERLLTMNTQLLDRFDSYVVKLGRQKS